MPRSRTVTAKRRSPGIDLSDATPSDLRRRATSDSGYDRARGFVCCEQIRCLERADGLGATLETL